MTGEINQISKILGALDSRQDSFEKTMDDNHAIINQKLDKIFKGLQENSKMAERANNRLDTMLSEDGVIFNLKRDVEDYKKTKTRGLLALSGIGAISGTAGGGLLQKFIAIFSATPPHVP